MSLGSLLLFLVAYVLKRCHIACGNCFFLFTMWDIALCVIFSPFSLSCLASSRCPSSFFIAIAIMIVSRSSSLIFFGICLVCGGRPLSLLPPLVCLVLALFFSCSCNTNPKFLLKAYYILPSLRSLLLCDGGLVVGK